MKHLHFKIWVILSMGLSAALLGTAPKMSARRASQAITAARAYATVEFLTSPECAGRLTGTPGYGTAARWAGEEFRKAGLKPLPGEKEFLLPFPVTLYGVETASLSILKPGDPSAPPSDATMGKDFMPMAASDSCDVEAEVIFAGYGITAPELGRDDYAGLDVRGKIVLVLRGVPKDGKTWRGHSDTPSRASTARAHGAAAMLLVDSAVLSVHAGRVPGLGMAMVGDSLADAVLADAQIKVADLRSVLNRGGTASFPTGRSIRFTVKALSEKPATGWNVASFIPGTDPRIGKDYFLVGGHLDHLGSWPELNPGANDNASGAAAVLEIARAAATLNPAPKRSLVFVLFGGEEMGLLGSKKFAQGLPKGLGTCLGVYNLDMVGQGTGAYVSGGTNFPDLFRGLEAARDEMAPGLQLKGGPSSGEARADHGPFQEAGIPAVSLFGAWGVSHGYHTPEDTLFWLTPKTIESLARITFLAAANEADREPGSGGR